MRFKIPFTFSRLEKLKKRAKFFSSRFKHKKKSKLEETLNACDIQLTREEFLGICFRSLFINFFFLLVISTTISMMLELNKFYLISLGLSSIFSLFIFFSQRVYPKIYVSRKQKKIEKDLLPALEDILIQLNSGIPLFSIMTNISYSDYGVLSLEFKKAVKRINAGEPEAEVLNNLGKKNPSLYFRRVLWQISNGMMAGSDMSIVIKDSIKALNEEQLIQIQNYGNRLNPLIVMYMLITVIIPTLSITFLTIITSMIDIEKNSATLLFISLGIFVIFAQIMFLGLIKSRRPSLL
ncbi:type II secretion system F family protein [archaeon]|jgi:pilus assembly protein TadC|nr:type II secretion system F family protein [archaeon]MBT4241616.1 type II secretion system F family protein [archaeon]MBT4418011.1 type II secretion system F family protein [archaeon]